MNLKTKNIITICEKIVRRLDLDLSSLTVITECASGTYLYTPIIAALAGAQVYALGKDTRFGTFGQCKKSLIDVATSQGLNEKINVQHVKDFDDWKKGDVITNSGMLRPFTTQQINRMSSTSVFCLMWETWEIRDGELDIKAFQKRKIPVIGTNEGYSKANMYNYPGLMVLKVLLDFRIEVGNGNILLLGGGLTGKLIYECLVKLGATVKWFSGDPTANQGSSDYLDFNKIHTSSFEHDAMIIAEHTDNRPLFDTATAVNLDTLKQKSPDLFVLHLCGNIDTKLLDKSGLQYYPEQIAPFGYMSFLPDNISDYPVLLLNAAGLKVGEIAAKVRRSGESAESSIQATLEHGIGMDFKNGFFNFGLDIK